LSFINLNQPPYYIVNYYYIYYEIKKMYSNEYSFIHTDSRNEFSCFFQINEKQTTNNIQQITSLIFVARENNKKINK
jgi:hypothetical protein